MNFPGNSRQIRVVIIKNIKFMLNYNQKKKTVTLRFIYRKRKTYEILNTYYNYYCYKYYSNLM